MLVAAESKLARERGELDSLDGSVSGTTSTNESEEEEEDEDNDDLDASNDDDEDEEAEDNTQEPGLGARRSRGKKAKGEVEDISRLLLADYFHCRKPLSTIDLTGVVKRLAHRLYSRCVYCGRVCEVRVSSITRVWGVCVCVTCPI